MNQLIQSKLSNIKIITPRYMMFNLPETKTKNKNLEENNALSMKHMGK